MNNSYDLTVGKLRRKSNLDDSLFLDLYSRLVTGKALEEDEYVDLLRFAIIFLDSADVVVSRLGYRILLQYGEVTNDYEPIHSVARAQDLLPLAAAAERLNPHLAGSETFTNLLYEAHSTNFVTHEQDGSRILRTRGQMELRSFSAKEHEAVVIAPTSYGKSEMLVEKVAQNLRSRTCILVPTRALIGQTRTLLIQDPRIVESRVRVIAHADSYSGEQRFIAVMTQERLKRLFVENPSLTLDTLLVDEAHNLLAGDVRAITLSQSVLIARSRNSNLAVTYYTPFLAEPANLKHLNGVDVDVRTRSVSENLKAERLVLATPGRPAKLYDQFLNRFFNLGDNIADDEVSAVLQLAMRRTLVYVNRPKDAQGLADRLSKHREGEVPSKEARRAMNAIADLVDPNYSLIRAIEKGVLFHHGQVPDILRGYIEHLFRNDTSEGSRILVTTSTLLEGVNTPADCLVMMTLTRGRSNLSRTAFRNLIGRVARLREVFAKERTDLDLLQPRIFLVKSSYSKANANFEDFLSRVADISKHPNDSVDNPLLEGSADLELRNDSLEYLENIEPGSTPLDSPRLARTAVGRLCFRNDIRDFDIFADEERIQTRIDAIATTQPALSNTAEVVDAICEIFLGEVELHDEDDLARVRDSLGARKFYAMFLGWRSRNESFKRMVGHFIKYWSNLEDELVYVGSKWGEVAYGDSGFRTMFVRMKSKSRAQMVDLAVVKIKEEQDFVDFRLLSYIEVLNSLGMIEEELYLRLKFGTADPTLICLLNNGFSPELARLTKDAYISSVLVNLSDGRVEVSHSLSSRMHENGENDILVHEALTLAPVSSGSSSEA